MLGKKNPELPPIVIKKRVAPKTLRCPVCGTPGRRKYVRQYVAKDLAHRRVCEWHVSLGVYQAKCNCMRTVRRRVNGQWVEVEKSIKVFSATVPGLEPGQRYTDAVREKIVDLVIRDHLSNMQTLEHLREEHGLKVSEGFIYLCLEWAQKKGALSMRIVPGVWRTSRASCA